MPRCWTNKQHGMIDRITGPTTIGMPRPNVRTDPTNQISSEYRYANLSSNTRKITKLRKRPFLLSTNLYITSQRLKKMWGVVAHRQVVGSGGHPIHKPIRGRA